MAPKIMKEEVKEEDVSGEGAEPGQEPKKRKRGRPKGSKNKPQYYSYGRDYIDPDEVAR